MGPIVSYHDVEAQLMIELYQKRNLRVVLFYSVRA